MHVFIGAKRLGHYLDHSIPPPKKPEPITEGAKEEEVRKYEKENKKFRDWMVEDTETKHYLYATILDTRLVEALACATAKDIWQGLCTVHEGKTKMFKMEMIRRIHNERCTDTDDIRAHFAKMLRLREDLAATGEILDEENFANILTNSLPKSYGNVVSTAYTTASMNNKIPTTQQLIAVIEAEYMRRQITGGGLPGSPTPVALYTNPQKSSSPKKKKKNVSLGTNTDLLIR